MNDGRPGKLIGKSSISEAKGLAVLLQARADAAALGVGQSQWARMRARMSLFNVGRFVSLAAGLLVLFALMERHAGTPSLAFGVISTFVALLGLPILLSLIVQGARMRMFGAAEFFCGLAYTPMGTIGGAHHRERTQYMLALIYSGVGRFEEAKKLFRQIDANHNIFDIDPSATWSERKRLPELLARMGETQEAMALAEQNIALTKHQLKAAPCLQLAELLQCELIAAAHTAGMCGQAEKRTGFLDEAVFLEQTSKKLQIFGSYASAIKHFDARRYQEAATNLVSMADAINEGRMKFAGEAKVKTNANGKQLDQYQEIWSLSQTLLGRCYLQLFRLEKLPEILLNLEKSNRSEPPAADNCVDVALLKIDYLAAQGKHGEALANAAALIKLLGESDCPTDRMLITTAERYAAIAEAGGIEEDGKVIEKIADKLKALAPLTPRANAATHTYIAAEPHAVPPRLSSLADSRRIANRAVFFASSFVLYTIYLAATGHAQTMILMCAAMSVLAISMTALDVRKHNQNRRRRKLVTNVIAQHLGSNAAVRLQEVVLSPRDGKSSFLGLRNCTIKAGSGGDESAVDFVRKEIEMALDDNLIYVCAAYRAADLGEIGARAYIRENNIIGVEVLGRVLTPVK